MMKRLKGVARTLIQLRTSVPAYLHWSKALRKDPLFKLSAADRGLQPRPTSPGRSVADRTAAAKRVIDAYRSATKEQECQRDVYRASYMWLSIFRKPLQPLLARLNEGDAEGLRDLLDNFFRSSVSYGLCGLATDMEESFFKRRPSHFARMQFLIDAVYRYRHLETLVPGVDPSALHVEDIGNPYGIFVNDQFVRTGAEYQYYYARKVSTLLPASGHRTVLELGGGTGGFGYFLCRLVPSGLTYINLDLPEILCVSSYQLLNLFPEKKILLHGEGDTTRGNEICSYDIALLPSFAIEGIAADSVDVAFNSYSLAEMSRDTIENYSSHLSRVSRGAIYHVNHVSDAAIGGDQFPFDSEKFEQKSRIRALWNRGRNLKCDEYEFLLTRRADARTH